MTITSSEKTGETLETEQSKSIRDALELAHAFGDVAGFLSANPDLAKKATVHFAPYTLISATSAEDPIAYILDAARRGREYGARVEEYAEAEWGGVRIYFGPLHVQVYAPSSQVCRRVVVGVVEDVQYALTVDLDGNPRKDAEQPSEVTA